MRRAFAIAALVLAASCAKKSDSIPDAGPAIVESTAPSPELKAKLGNAFHTKDWPYIPNTRHKNADGSPKYTNRLILETSPYLLQHAHNPVNWFPWGDEAFALAKRLGRPVFLSIGYSTCHWCHVMEEESFEDEEIARVLNEGYVPIKVDREERPDVDAIYIAAVMALTGSGGWPTTLLLTPDREPFFGGTYFPARDGDRGSGMGLLTLLQSTRKTYDENPKNVTNAAARLVAAVRDHMKPELGGVVANAEILDAAAESYRSRFDETNGGTTGAPKFPSSMPVRFLLRQHRRTGNKDALRMASVTLERMADGGIHDHVGGGFHRYATDVDWRIPHFEKMLYDNAGLTMAYLEGFQATRNPAFGRIARETLRYVEREMTSPNGGFYSATDADSLDPQKRLEEGYFFTWTPDEIDTVLGAETGKKASTYFNVTARGDVGGRSVLHLAHGVSAREAPKEIEAARTLLYDARAKRTPPRRDEKILTSWNGLMISAFARGSLVLGDATLAEKAVNAANVILARSPNLSRTSHDDAYLDDYAFLIAGLLDLFEATGTRRWLDEAIRLDQVVEKHYEDTVGGFFLTSDTHEKLLAREKPSYDGAEPSGTSVHVLNLLRLAELTSKERYRTRSEYAIGSLAVVLQRDPTAMSEMLDALDFGLGTPKEIVIVTRGPRADAEPLLAKLRETFLPNRVLVVASEASLTDLASVIPLVAEKTARRASATAYVCEKNTCQLPTSSPAVFATQLAKVKP